MKPIEELMLNIKKDLKENLLLDANLSELPHCLLYTSDAADE